MVEAGADIIMLDNMEHDVMKEAIALIDGRAEIEISGTSLEKILLLTQIWQFKTRQAERLRIQRRFWIYRLKICILLKTKWKIF